LLQNLDQTLRAPRIHRAGALLNLQRIAQHMAWIEAQQDTAVAYTDAVLAAAQRGEKLAELQKQARAGCCCTALWFKLEE
jgi:hypothetical protein